MYIHSDLQGFAPSGVKHPFFHADCFTKFIRYEMPCTIQQLYVDTDAWKILQANSIFWTPNITFPMSINEAMTFLSILDAVR